MPVTQQRHYTVGYHDNQLHHYEICEYAMSAYEAIQHSKEDVPFLRAHPHFVDYCNDKSEIDNISRLMMSGIPMGH
tara:strand:+ start:2162 stop:2389 length:228 start_codon:yes stop_codon:yes gene_type:complete